MVAITLNLKEVDKAFDDLARKQVPFAAAKALTDTAKSAQKELQRQLPLKIDRPTPFTRRAFGVSRATKNRLISEVFVKDLQAEYLEYQIEGGTRSPKRQAVTLPTTIKLNQYGNIPSLRAGKKVKALLAKPNAFKGTVRGVSGIWQRTNKNKKLKLLIAFERTVTYKPRLPFYEIVGGVANSNINKNFVAALEHAIKTAR